MNLLEQYIEKIISEEEVEYNGGTFVYAKVKVNCCGHVSVEDHIKEKTQWEAEKKKGYYMA